VNTAATRPIKQAAPAEQVQNVIDTCKLLSGQPTDYFKIFAIGFNKTGTTSLYTLFKELGFAAMDGPHWRKREDWHIHYQFQAFSDGPPDDFRLLDQTFPRSKFILNVRELDEWLDSRIEHIRFRMQDKNYTARMSKGRLPDEDIICAWIQKRQRYHLDVLMHFESRKSDLLILNFISDDNATAKVADFLGRHSSNAKKPFTRSTPQTRTAGRLRNQDLLMSAFKRMNLPLCESHYDLLLPSLLPDSTKNLYPHDTRLPNHW